MNKLMKCSLPVGIAGIVINLIFFITNLFYELVVPFLENSSIDGTLFHFLDALIFYTPCIFIVLFIALIVFGHIYKKKAYVKSEGKKTEVMIEKNAEVQKILDKKAEFLKYDYYSNCPNCGSPRNENEQNCSFCGASLIIRKIDEE